MEATMLEAKTNLSKYVALVESGQVDRVVLRRNKQPVAQIEPYAEGGGFEIGIAAGEFVVGDVDADNDAVASLFYGM